MDTTDKQVGWHKALINRNIENKLMKIEVTATIDELEQYLNGNVTKLGLRMALNELIRKL
jgi:hypothetical protein